MSEEAIVLRLIGFEVFGRLLPARPTSAPQISVAEGAQREFGLVEPRSVRWRLQDAESWMMAAQENMRLPGYVTVSAVPDEMNTTPGTVQPKELPQSRKKINELAGIQTRGSHAPGVDDKRHEEIDGFVPSVLKLAFFDLSRPHWLRRASGRYGPGQRARVPSCPGG